MTPITTCRRGYSRPTGGLPSVIATPQSSLQRNTARWHRCLFMNLKTLRGGTSCSAPDGAGNMDPALQMEHKQITWLKTTNKSCVAAGNATFEMRRQREPAVVVSLKLLDVNCNCEYEWGLPIRNSRRPPDERCPGTGCLLAHSEKQTKTCQAAFLLARWAETTFRTHLLYCFISLYRRLLSIFYFRLLSLSGGRARVLCRPPPSSGGRGLQSLAKNPNFDHHCCV